MLIDYDALTKFYAILDTKDADRISESVRDLSRKVDFQKFLELLNFAVSPFKWDSPAKAYKVLAPFLQENPYSPYYVAALEKYFEILPSYANRDVMDISEAGKIGHALAGFSQKIELPEFQKYLDLAVGAFSKNSAGAHKVFAAFFQEASSGPFYGAVLEKYFEMLPSFMESDAKAAQAANQPAHSEQFPIHPTVQEEEFTERSVNPLNAALKAINQKWSPGNEIDEFFKSRKDFLGNIADPSHRVLVKYELCVSVGQRKFPALEHRQDLAESAFNDAKLAGLEECGKVLNLLSPASYFYERALKHILNETGKVDDAKLLGRLVSASARPIAIASPNEAIDPRASQRLETLLRETPPQDRLSKAMAIFADIGFNCKTRRVAINQAFSACGELIEQKVLAPVSLALPRLKGWDEENARDLKLRLIEANKPMPPERRSFGEIMGRFRIFLPRGKQLTPGN